MQNKIKKTSGPADFRVLANLIYYKRHYDEATQIDDLSTALSYETIVSICTKHLGIEEAELLSKKGTKYSYHRDVFIGVLYFYLNVNPRPLAKKIGRYMDTVKRSSEVLCYYLEPYRKYNAAGLQFSVEKIITECEKLSGKRFLKNVCPKLRAIYPPLPHLSKIEIIRESENPIFSPEEIESIPVKDLGWFRANQYAFQAFSIKKKYQATIYTKNYYNDQYLCLMQSFGYRFLTTLEYSAMCLESAAKINARTAEKLKSMFNRNTEEENKKREMEIYMQPKVPGKVVVSTSLLLKNMLRSQLN